VEKVMTSTAEGQQRWNTLMESGKAGVDAFFQSISTGALNGGFGIFIENISTAITLTANYQTALNNFKTTQFVNQLKNIGNELKINQLELEKLQIQQAGGDTAAIDKKIGIVKGEEIINAESDLRGLTSEYDAWIRKISGYQGPTFGEDLIKQFEDYLKLDPASFLDEHALKMFDMYAKDLNDLANSKNKGLRDSAKEKRKGTDLIPSTADKLKANVNEDVRKEAAERAKKIAELKGIRIKADKEAADAQIKSDEEAAAAAIKIAEEKAVAAKKI
jgi:hypothetical protein